MCNLRRKGLVFFHLIFHLFIQGLVFKTGKTKHWSPRTCQSIFIKQHLSMSELCHSYRFLLAKSTSAQILSISLKTGLMVHNNVHLTVTSFIMIQWQSKATKLVSTTWNREQISYQSACLWKPQEKYYMAALCKWQKTKHMLSKTFVFNWGYRTFSKTLQKHLCYCLTC